MNYVLKERIGNPDLFTGRKEELAYFLNWIMDIKKEKSQSTVILSRSKMGKTALMERLFNIIFHQNDGVIPFYYEIKELEMWSVDFCVDFFLTFIYQYIAFKSRKEAYIKSYQRGNLIKAKQVAQSEGFGYLGEWIDSVAYSVAHGQIDILWETVREAPKSVATSQNEFIIQMIDEFQFLNTMIFWDKHKTYPAKKMAGGYFSTAESKIAPLLISSSWVGGLMNELNTLLPAHFDYLYIENMPEDEALEMVYKYSSFYEVPLTPETAYLIVHMTEGSPFYISSIIRSGYRNKNLTTLQGLTDTLEFETLSNRGKIKSTWMEYILSAFNKENDINAKNIVLYLCKHRDREVTRRELLEKLPLHMTDAELEKKLKALIRADIVRQGHSNFDYRGVQDHIFDKVFQGVFEKEIYTFDEKDIRYFDVRGIAKEYHEGFKKLKKQYHQQQGKEDVRKL